MRALLVILIVGMTVSGATQTRPVDQRAFLIKTLTRIADPLLTALSKNQLRQKMPVEARKGVNDRAEYTHLEGFARLLAGMAPWLELGPDSSVERKLREKYIQLSLSCIRNATDPAAPDFMNFSKGKQPLVDAAFLAEALLRAPRQLWGRLDARTRQNLLTALKSSRAIKPYESNWLLFSAMVEAAFLKLEGECVQETIHYAVRKHFEWYKGDGVYGDGPMFHWDYYNSFVIQPMLLEVLAAQVEAGLPFAGTYDTVLKRAIRYAAVQERLIAPDGTYPVLGRSLAYRFGAFHHLAKICLLDTIPPGVKRGQLRSALYTMVKKQVSMPGTFDKNGWLRIGFAGAQKDIGETYISTGSLYLCSQVFLILGIPANAPFWTEPDADWTSKKAWKGLEIPIDHAVD